MRTSKSWLLITCCVLCTCLLSSCAAVIIGAGAAGAGAFAYTKGKLSRMYKSEYHETVQASIDTLQSLKIPSEDKVADELKTIIYAKRPDGTPVHVEVLRVSPKYTEVSIRTGKIGVFDKKTSFQIHDYILSRLNNKDDIHSSPENLSTEKSTATEKDIGYNASQSGIEPDIEISGSKELTVYFDVGTNSLKGEEIEKLDLFYENLDKQIDEKIVIIGFSDSTGSPNYNKKLSLYRAETVQMYLVGKGIPNKQTEVYGYGLLNFVSSNATEYGRRLNRRVEIYLQKRNGKDR